MKQKILTIVTDSASLRSTSEAWGVEDGDLVNMDKPIGLSPSGPLNAYDCPLKAIGDGWRLIGPPQETTFNTDKVYYRWWFEKK
jgi:hypothetical protein